MKQIIISAAVSFAVSLLVVNQQAIKKWFSAEDFTEKILKICKIVYVPVFILWCMAAIAKIILLCMGIT